MGDEGEAEPVEAAPAPEQPKGAFAEETKKHQKRVEILYLLTGALLFWLLILVACVLYIVAQCDTVQVQTTSPIIIPGTGTYGPGYDDEAKCAADGCLDGCFNEYGAGTNAGDKHRPALAPQPWLPDYADEFGNCPGYCGPKFSSDPLGKSLGNCQKESWFGTCADCRTCLESDPVCKDSDVCSSQTPTLRCEVQCVDCQDLRGENVAPKASYCPFVDVQIRATDVESTIYYTDDGTTPCVGGIKYNGQTLSYSRNTEVKALAISPNKRQSERIAHVFKIRGALPPQPVERFRQ